MAKEKKKVTEVTALEPNEAATPVVKKARQAAPKNLPDQRLYLPALNELSKYAEPSTVFGVMRQFVLDNGGSALRSEILDYMVANYKPKKSTMSIDAFVKSYLRDVTRLGFLSEVDHGAMALAQKTVRQKTAKSVESSGLSKMGESLVKALKAELTLSEVQAGSSSVTVESLAAAVNKNAQTVRMSLKSLIKHELARYQSIENVEYIVLTQKGWDVEFNAAPETPAEAE